MVLRSSLQHVPQTVITSRVVTGTNPGTRNMLTPISAHSGVIREIERVSLKQRVNMDTSPYARIRTLPSQEPQSRKCLISPMFSIDTSIADTITLLREMSSKIFRIRHMSKRCLELLPPII